jgi:hypothetical protein
MQTAREPTSVGIQAVMHAAGKIREGGEHGAKCNVAGGCPGPAVAGSTRGVAVGSGMAQVDTRGAAWRMRRSAGRSRISRLQRV